MPIRLQVLLLLAGVLQSTVAAGQRVVTKNGTPAAVAQALKDNLLPQGFTYRSGNEKEAILMLDRGMVPQQSMYNNRTHSNLFHVFIELHVRFKPKAEGLEITAYEDVVGSDQPGGTEDFRRRVTTRIELDTLQRLLDHIQATLDARSTSPDSSTKRDSTP